MENSDFKPNSRQSGGRGSLFPIIVTNLTIPFLLPLMTALGIILFPPSFAVVKVATGWDADRIMRLFVWIYGKAWLGITAPFTRFKKEGFQGVPIRPPCIMVVNHFSFFDTFFMGALPFSDVTFAVRSWPFRMFWYTPFMRLARYLDVERLGWEATFKECQRVITNKGALLFFPEAHRSRNGTLGRFHSGAFKVAVNTGTAVVPLCIAGTERFFPPGRFWIEPTQVRLRALPAVEPGDFHGASAHMEMRKAVKRLMAETLHEMTHGRGPGTSSGATAGKCRNQGSGGADSSP